MNVVDQNPCELVLGVSNRELPCSLTVLTKETVYVGAYAFTFHVLGESHLVSIQRNGEIYWQELLSCRKLPHSGLLHHRHFTRLDHHNWQYRQNGIHYEIGARISEKPLFNAQSRNYLEVGFPTICGTVPFTRVQWQLDELVQAQTNREVNRLRWQTVHTYPHPKGVTHVISESIIYVQ